jgi:sec-independent protein translocase protein TatC
MKEIEGSEHKEMSFLDHLEELRWRIVKAFSAILIGAVVVFFFKEWLFDGVIFAPMREDFFTYRAFCSMSYHLGFEDKLCFTDLILTLQSINMVTQITMHIVASLIAGLILAFPFVFYQVWGFISPGLKKEERKQANGMTIWVSVLFFLGVAFGYFIIVPLSVQFLGNYQVSSLVKNNIDISSYVSTVTTLTLATGVLFQLPVVVIILARLGLITAAMLKTYRKHALVVVLIVSAIITPPDIASQVLVTLPIMVLYEFSIFMARRIEKKRNAKMKNA